MAWNIICLKLIVRLFLPILWLSVALAAAATNLFEGVKTSSD